MGREIQNYTTGKFYSFLVPNLFSALFSVLDTSISNVLTGRLLGDQALAALNSALPVYLLVCTLASGLSCGFFYLASLAYGRAENRKAESLFSLSVEVSLLLSLIVTVLGYILSPAIASLLATGPLYDMALSYIRTVFLGSVMIIMAYVPFHFLRLEGKVRISAAAVVLMLLLWSVSSSLPGQGGRGSSSLQKQISRHCLTASVTVFRVQATTFSFLLESYS